MDNIILYLYVYFYRLAVNKSCSIHLQVRSFKPGYINWMHRKEI